MSKPMHPAAIAALVVGVPMHLLATGTVGLIVIGLVAGPQQPTQASVPSGATLIEHDVFELQSVGVPSVAWTPASGNDTSVMLVSHNGGAYTVQPGDTLQRIAAEHGTSWQALQSTNRLADADRIYVGQSLKITGTDRVAEDSSGWDCRTMGNRQCGAYVEGIGWYVITFDHSGAPIAVRQR